MYPNPIVREPVYRLLGDVANITLTPPLDYLSTVHILKSASLVLTDSGGLREEARGLGKPVLVLREVTERPEGVEAGTAKAVGTKREDITGKAVLRLEDPTASAAMATAVNPHGDGRTGQRSVQAILGSTRIHGAMHR